jgi:hypothetical protein
MADADPGKPRNEDEAEPVIAPGHTLGTVTDKISALVLVRPYTRGWIFGFALSFTLMMVLLVSVTYLFAVGVGIWGVNQPVGWGFAIVTSSGGSASATRAP